MADQQGILSRHFWRAWEGFIGMQVAFWLDELLPNHCWANVCTKIGFGWDLAEFVRTPLRFFDEECGAEGCRRESQELGSCWCGKFTDETARERYRRANRVEPPVDGFPKGAIS